MAQTKSAPKPTEKQKAVLAALSGPRRVTVTETNGRKKVSVTTPSGKPVADAPKLDRAAVEGCYKRGWLTHQGGSKGNGSYEEHYQITDEGKKARKAR